VYFVYRTIKTVFDEKEFLIDQFEGAISLVAANQAFIFSSNTVIRGGWGGKPLAASRADRLLYEQGPLVTERFQTVSDQRSFMRQPKRCRRNVDINTRSRWPR
jgi:hypothetical protein